MKRLFLPLVFACSCFLLPAQSGSTLYDNGRIDHRSGPTTFNPEWAPFYHGVASGDPLEDRVIIWTRVTPEVMDGNPIEVDWKMATDPNLENVLQSGTVQATDSADYTVKVDVTGLDAGGTYYYGFSALDKNSLTGKTKTTPTGDQSDHLKFGVVSCSNFQGGYFNAYQRLAERRDLDAIIHLGDYIYEYGDQVFGDSSLFDDRPLEPLNEIITLEEYRTRYSTYRLDTSLIRVHQQHPFIVVWDDHESANNSYTDGAQNHTEGAEGAWEDRKQVSKQAYFEWLPIRETDGRKVYRTIRYGNLMDLFMIDSRLEGRDQQINDPFAPELQDTNRTMLGSEQKSWLLEQLESSVAKWKMIGNQVVFAPVNVGWIALIDSDTTTGYSLAQGLAQDMWNGYPAERTQILDFIQQKEIDNIVVLTGDLHVTLALDVADPPVDVAFQDLPGYGATPFYTPNNSYNAETGEGSLLVEFASPSITSDNYDERFGILSAIGIQLLVNKEINFPPLPNLGVANPHLKYPDLINHGYYILDVKPDSAQASFYFSDILTIEEEEEFGQAWYTKDGDNHLSLAADESGPKAEQDVPAPNDPPQVTATEEVAKDSKFVLLAMYPNPFSDINTLHYSLKEKAKVVVQLYTSDGKLVRTLSDRQMTPGIYSLRVQADDLPNGIYHYRIQVDQEIFQAKLVLLK